MVTVKLARIASLAALSSISALSQSAPAKRPQITGIDHVAFYSTQPHVTEHLYMQIIGLPSTSPVEPNQTQRFIIGNQWIGYSPAPDASANSRMDHVAFRTDDVEALRLRLASAGVEVPAKTQELSDGSHNFLIRDPEGNRIEFVQPRKSDRLAGRVASLSGSGEPTSRRLIHAGFIVHNRAAEDRFYKDLLGFRLYWHGGMQPGNDDWVAMQVPNGTDWLEYMLNQPASPDLRRNGVMDHISLGVPDMKRAQAKLESNGWKATDREHSQLGKDGKWQLNLYDPDFTRIELMEFRPVQKPCCSEFEGPHPSD